MVYDWKSAYIPKEIQDQLLRMGIQLENSTDLHPFESNEKGSAIRVVYHAVGKTLSGPNQWQKKEVGKVFWQSVNVPSSYVKVYPFRALVIS
jgi:hypothetical protein